MPELPELYTLASCITLAFYGEAPHKVVAHQRVFGILGMREYLAPVWWSTGWRTIARDNGP